MAADEDKDEDQGAWAPDTDPLDALDKITAQMSGGEHRPEQQEMCRAVAEALVTQTHLVVRAGTGTGKSLAYLVPAALSGKKVVVATATTACIWRLRELPRSDAFGIATVGKSPP
jgi:ATP-dependent DNA helicase DinG